MNNPNVSTPRKTKRWKNEEKTKREPRSAWSKHGHGEKHKHWERDRKRKPLPLNYYVRFRKENYWVRFRKEKCLVRFRKTLWFNFKMTFISAQTFWHYRVNVKVKTTHLWCLDFTLHTNTDSWMFLSGPTSHPRPPPNMDFSLFSLFILLLLTFSFLA